jgi:hypothetical protein
MQTPRNNRKPRIITTAQVLAIGGWGGALAFGLVFAIWAVLFRPGDQGLSDLFLLGFGVLVGVPSAAIATVIVVAAFRMGKATALGSRTFVIVAHILLALLAVVNGISSLVDANGSRGFGGFTVFAFFIAGVAAFVVYAIGFSSAAKQYYSTGQAALPRSGYE